MVAYQTAYLKRHYPREYMAALMTSVLDTTAKLIEYIEECTRLEIPVLPPDINQSDDGLHRRRRRASGSAFWPSRIWAAVSSKIF